ncbi:exodeoxyribonuclease V subunit alpha [Thaumasiovibrio subtropicus]|uniref:exodeoxyribonuclease V subunit alpha n=1 Tax=Thaumasiovibrio subtropicus TaxID=1891207 RepID=UPI000B362B05|nr:exodeoxyribonuclease V subunit alpha [Thaumasiovibrio subtropicus]
MSEQENISLVLARFAELVDRNAIRAIDYQFARYVSMQPEMSATAVLWAAQVSYRAGQGHVCVDLSARQRWFDLHSQEINWLLEGITWRDPSSALANAHCVGDGDRPAPLILNGSRLYLARYWFDEQVVARYLRSNSAAVEVLASLPHTLDALFTPYLPALQTKLRHSGSPEAMQQAVIDSLDIVAPQQVDWAAVMTLVDKQPNLSELAEILQYIPATACLNWQKVAAAVALSRRFSVISGGPGTGKTTTVVRLLAAWVEQAQGVPLVIKLVAPTGKAAARLTESIGGALQQLAVAPEVKVGIPTEATTLHRLLGAVPDRVAFRHHHQNRLHLDVLVVDEASMVDLTMMARLMEAMPDHARLVLLGDKDQLASVEAGSVLGDICQFAAQGYSEYQAAHLSHLTGYHVPVGNPTTPLADSLCMLQKSHRFHAQSGIGQLAYAVNCGHPAMVDAVWQQGFADIDHHALSGENYAALIRRLSNAYKAYFLAAKEGQSPETVLALFADVRLLCAIREGDTGVIGMNQRIERHLRQQGLIQDRDEVWYVGRPVMINQNDYALGLSNGDIGITLYDAEQQRLRVYFQLPDGDLKGVLPSRLPGHETAYAMTIHKSQGSEFAHTFMLLPAKMNPVITKELIYTGITRAKQQLSIYADMSVLQQGITKQTERLSGLPALLQ